MEDREPLTGAPELKEGMHIHLVGIGGAGLSAIARVLLGRGHRVSGSDQQPGEALDALAALGAAVTVGHRPENVAGSDLVLISSAVSPDNVELLSARRLGIPVVKRAALLNALMQDSYGIAVAGSHGKSTTTGMIAQVLLSAGLDPTVILGSALPAMGANARAGGRLFVVEADEYDHMFLGLRPQIAVLTNVEHDHPDQFPGVEEYRLAFSRFVRLVPAGGKLIFCAEDAGAAEIARSADLAVRGRESYGLSSGDWRATGLTAGAAGCRFEVRSGPARLGPVALQVPGEHNVLNALAACAVAGALGVDFERTAVALGEFAGLSRRFEVIGEAAGVVVVDDYAHHPTEIRATLAAARGRYPGRRIWAAWQPHTYSRVKALLSQFTVAFDAAGEVVVLDIYRSRERDTLGLDAASIARQIRHPRVHSPGGVTEATRFILDRIEAGDVLVTLSAGDGNQVGRQVL
jgi:UDP-N-acetylmuramate--alanine ligase